MPSKKLVFFALVNLVAGAFAQQTNRGGLTGTVTDSSGAIVPGARVTAVNSATDVSQSTMTTTRGLYFINFLPIGSYSITVLKSGFETEISRDIQVIAGQTTTANFPLRVGGATERVTVTGVAAGVNTTDTSQGTTRTQEELQNLPISLQGIAARAAVSAVQTFSGVNFNLQQSSGQAWSVVSRSLINGVNGSGFGYQIDGVEASTGESENAEDWMSPTPSQIAEVRVTSNTDASQGFNGGTTVALVMKSGTNKLHGNVDYYNRNDALEARNFFLPVKAKDKQNEGGWTLGGPVVIPHVYNGKDKTFFFASMDIFRYVTTATPPSTPAVNTVPTALMQQGNFTQLLGKQVGTDAMGRPVLTGEIYDPASTRTLADGTSIRDPFMTGGQLNVVPISRLSSISQFFGSHYAPPTLPGVVNNWIGTSAPTVIDKDQWSLKIDHSIGPNHRLTFDTERQFGLFDAVAKCGYGHFASYGSAGYVDGVDAATARLNCSQMYRYRAAYVWTIKPTLVFEFRAGVTRDAHRDVTPLGPQAANAACQAGLKGTLSCNTPRIGIENFSVIGPSTWFLLHSQRTPFTASTTWSKGSHMMAFGADYVTAPFVYGNLVGSYGNFSFNHLETSLPGTYAGQTGAGIASFYLGFPDSASVTSPINGKWNTWEGALYAQDKWRVTKKLTLNYGLRWEITSPSREGQNKISSFDPNMPNPGAGNRPGALAVGLTHISDYYSKAFGPRLGLAYALNSKTVFRANFGIAYYPYWSKWYGSNGPATPSDGFNQTKTVASLNNGVTTAFNWDQGFPYTFPTFPIVNPSLDNGGPITYIDQHFNRPPMVENFGGEIERELPGHAILRVGYVGTMAHRLYASYNLNTLPLQYLSLGSLLNQNITSAAAKAAGIGLPYAGFNGTVAQALTPYPQYTAVTDLEAQIGNSSYNSLQINFQRHFGSLTFLANATIAKYLTMSDNPGNANYLATLKAQSYQLQNTSKSLGGYQPTTNGGQSGDISKQMNFSWYWDLPVGQGKRYLGGASKTVNYILGNWRLSGIQYYQGGVPIAVTSNQSVPSLGSAWPVLNSGVPITVRGCSSVQPGTAQGTYLNRAAFSDPAQYTLGNVYVLSTARACPFFNEDLSIDKGFSLAEKGRASVGAVVTNIFNRHQFNNLNVNIDSPSFGTFSGASFARSVQLYMKVVF